MKYKIISLVLVFKSFFAFSQSENFYFYLEKVEIEGVGGLQSFSIGQFENKWLVLGGRLDGLHRRQPFASFDLAGHNNKLIVIDPINKNNWSLSLDSTNLPLSLKEQLKSTNMEFYQEDSILYCIGGYGFSTIENDHTTFDNLIRINIPKVIYGIINNQPVEEFFSYNSNPIFQVTGGKLKKINSTFYLLGGQKFIGRYNPMGPNNGPGFIQEYTNAIRKFKIGFENDSIQVYDIEQIIDNENLHRRDYNAEAQILPNGSEGLTMFSGVFQYDVDLPFLNSVTIDSLTYIVNNVFQQYYNHYHCPVIPIYSSQSNEMHNVFFGGIAQFYDSLGILVQDDNVPFVRTIARVTRNSQNELNEYKLNIEMPELIGAGAEFILNMDIPHYNNKVIKLDELEGDSILMGYIYGGINSSNRNIFFINEGNESFASSEIYKVYLIKSEHLSIHKLNKQNINSINLIVYPNPSKGELEMEFILKEKADVLISIFDLNGQIVEVKKLKDTKVGANYFKRKFNKIKNSGTFIFQFEINGQKTIRKIIIES